MKRSPDVVEPGRNPLIDHLRSYYPGTYMLTRPFQILLVSGAEARKLRKSSIPVSDLTDKDAQIKNARRVKRLVHNLGGIRSVRETSIGFVQDTPGARSALREGSFSELSPRVHVYPDLAAEANF